MTPPDLGELMEKAKQMQSRLAELQRELAVRRFEGDAGGGMVTVTVNGKNDILSITIDPEVIDKDDVEMLEDLIVAAVNQAKEKAAELQAEDMAKLTGGLKIPGLPF